MLAKKRMGIKVFFFLPVGIKVLARSNIMDESVDLLFLKKKNENRLPDMKRKEWTVQRLQGMVQGRFHKIFLVNP